MLKTGYLRYGKTAGAGAGAGECCRAAGSLTWSTEKNKMASSRLRALIIGMACCRKGALDTETNMACKHTACRALGSLTWLADKPKSNGSIDQRNRSKLQKGYLRYGNKHGVQAHRMPGFGQLDLAS